MQGTLALTFALVESFPLDQIFSLSSSHLFQEDLVEQRVPAPHRQEVPLPLGNYSSLPFLLVVPCPPHPVRDHLTHTQHLASTYLIQQPLACQPCFAKHLHTPVIPRNLRHLRTSLFPCFAPICSSPCCLHRPLLPLLLAPPGISALHQ